MNAKKFFVILIFIFNIMRLTLFGISHKTAPIEVREKFYLTSLEQELFLSEMKNHPAIVEGFVLSTCNRTEIYLHGLDAKINLDFILHLFTAIKKISFDLICKKYFYTLRDDSAAEHLLRVASGADSLVVGEKQILGQVKQAVERARTKGMLTKYFNILSSIAIRTGKIVQHRTYIGYGGTSISWAAVTMAEKTLGSLKDKSLLVIGAGEMSELAVGQITHKGFQKLYLMNQTECHAEVIAKKYNGVVVSFGDIKEILREVDVCICATGAPHYILEVSTVEKVIKARCQKPLVFIDISMPRNIDPRIAGIEGVLLFEIDDLDKAIEENLEKRRDAVYEVERIIERKLSQLKEKMKALTSQEKTDYFEATTIS